MEFNTKKQTKIQKKCLGTRRASLAAPVLNYCVLTEPRTYLEVVFDCTISQITADGEARTAVFVCAAGSGLCSLQSGSRPLASVLVSPLTPAPVTVIGQ